MSAPGRLAPADVSPLVKASRDGLGISEDSIVFALTPSGYQSTEGDNQQAVVSNSSIRLERPRDKATVTGDVIVVRPQCLDIALWKIGGAAVVLRLVELAMVSAVNIA